jgi:hypothetical protein
MRIDVEIGKRPHRRGPWRATMTVLLITAALLPWSPPAFANAYPDAPVAYVPPACADGRTPATVYIDAGTITNSTTLDLSADGGTGIADSLGGDENLATTGGDGGRKDDGRGKHQKDNRKERNDRDRDGDGDESELAAAGNGGVADASADGGAIAVENVNSGGNVGSAIAVGDTWGGGYDACGNAVGGVYIDGGEVINETVITVSADGGTAIADASGGDGNIASAGGRGGNGGTITSSAGNGGVSTASADGGAISIGDVNSGGNAGNAIAVGDTVVSPGIVPVCCAPPPYPPAPVPAKPAPAPLPPGAVPAKVVVVRLPSTGSGLAADAGNPLLNAVATVVAGIAGIMARRCFS